MVKKLNLSGVVTEHEWFNTILWKFFPELPDQTDDKANKIHQEIMVISSFIFASSSSKVWKFWTQVGKKNSICIILSLFFCMKKKEKLK